MGTITAGLSGSLLQEINRLDDLISLKVDAIALTNLSSSISTEIDRLRVSGTSTSSSSGLFTFNEVPLGNIDGVNSQFALENTPNPASSLMLFYNGQLMKVGTDADYVLAGNIITFVSERVPRPDDVLLATYFYRVQSKNYQFNEPVIVSVDGMTRHAVLEHVPDPPNSLMLFRNGQLLMRGGDYILIDKNISTDVQLGSDDIFQATYSYS
jgi:hypothetical protein